MTIRSAGAIICVLILALAAGCSRESNPVEPGNQLLSLRSNALTAPAVGDRVWYDTNMDGVQGDLAEEPGIADVNVELFTCDTIPEMVGATVTDSMGYYAFESLAPGDYFVQFEAPDGFVFTVNDQGGDDMLDSDADPMTGRTGCFSIDSMTVNLNVDAGMYMVDTIDGAIVGDRVWMDANMNGVQDDTLEEPGMEGIGVALYSCQDSLIMMTTTDSEGMYHFMGVPAGEYYLGFDLPMGYEFTAADQGESDWFDSDVNPMTGMTACFTVAENVVYPFYDAGMYVISDSGCTRSKGYWKNHAGFGPQADVVSDLLPIWLGDADGDKSMAVTDARIAVDVLSMHTYGEPSNGITKLYAQLLAAKLNIANGAVDYDVADLMANADAFLAQHDWMDWDSLGKADRKMVLNWMGTLDDYNNGLIGPGYCGDEDHEGDDDFDHEDDD